MSLPLILFTEVCLHTFRKWSSYISNTYVRKLGLVSVLWMCAVTVQAPINNHCTVLWQHCVLLLLPSDLWMDVFLVFRFCLLSYWNILLLIWWYYWYPVVASEAGMRFFRLRYTLFWLLSTLCLLIPYTRLFLIISSVVFTNFQDFKSSLCLHIQSFSVLEDHWSLVLKIYLS